MQLSDGIALFALVISGATAFFQARSWLRSKRPRLSMRAERSIAKTDGFHLFDLVIKAVPANDLDDIDIDEVRVIEPGGSRLVSHLWNYVPPISVKPWEPSPKLTKAPPFDDLNPFDIEFAREGKGTSDSPLIVKAVIAYKHLYDSAIVQVTFSSRSLGGFNDKIRKKVKLEEFDLFR